MRGSLTVFAAISFMLIAELLFTLAEGVRYLQLGKIADLNTEVASETLLAEYNRQLWEEFQILGCDPGGESVGNTLSMERLEAEVMALTDMNYQLVNRLTFLPQTNLLRLAAAEAGFSDPELLTDAGGMCLVKAVSDYMEENLVYEETKFAISEAKELYELYQATQSITEEGGFSLGKIADALKAIADAASGEGSGEGNSEGNSKEEVSQSAGASPSPPRMNLPEESSRPTPAADRANPADVAAEDAAEDAADEAEEDDAEDLLTKAKKFMAKGVLAQVIPEDLDEVSDQALALQDVVSKRSLLKGSGKAELTWSDKILFEQYLLMRFSCYTGKGVSREESGALSYELEYLIGGKSSDMSNLAAVAGELLAIREACNLAYLAVDEEKQAALKTFAATVSAAAANPVLGEAVRAGLMAAWAYAESILDVRALLEGKKIPAIKSDATWSCSIENIAKVFDGTLQAVESRTGIGYRSWLGILLYAKGAGGVGLRSMDLMEKTLQGEDGCSAFRMDHLVRAANLTVHYRYSPLFLDFVPALKQSVPTELIRKKKVAYGK